MKLFNALVGIILFCYASSVSPTTINGRFTVLNATGSDFTVLLQINTNTGTNDLGGATIVFGFDTTVITITESPVKDVDYFFHNFCGVNYSPATVTRPMKNKIWVNIDLPFTNSNNGINVAANPEWTDVVTIHFDLVDPNSTASLSWLTTSPFWGIYDADNSTLWETGVFENFPTSVEPVPGLPTDYMLEQNYPNPFNPSTRIQYQVSSISYVSLVVYDILGNEVATLVNEEKQPGVYEVEFNIHSDEGQNLSSGIYFYQLKAGSFSSIKKMVLLK